MALAISTGVSLADRLGQDGRPSHLSGLWVLLDIPLGVVEFRVLQHIVLNCSPMLVESRIPKPECVGGELYNETMRRPNEVASEPIQLGIITSMSVGVQVTLTEAY